MKGWMTGVVLTVALAGPARAQSPVATTSTSGASALGIPGIGSKEGLKPIDIDADLFEVTGKDKRGVFRGNVVARQGDVTIRASKVEATYSQETHGVITKVVADGGVTVSSGTKVGKSDRAEFNNDKRTVVLTGEPRLWEEGIELEAKQIVFHVDDGRAECDSCTLVVDPTKVQQMKNDAVKPK